MFAVPRPAVDEAPALDQSLDQFFTPSWAADLMVADLLRQERGHMVLEPACGAGALLGAIGAGHGAVGVEIDPRMAAHARRATGRPVIDGDIRTVDLASHAFTAVLANPPFMADVIDAICDRAAGMLPDGGVMGLVLPAHIPASSTRMERWRERFEVETRLLPRSLFPRLTLPLTWNRLVRSDRRTVVGLFLFDEAADVHAMPDLVRRELQSGSTWRDVIAAALAAIGGEAELGEIYRAVEPRRRSPNPWWRDKVRQVLREGAPFENVGERRWRLAA